MNRYRLNQLLEVLLFPITDSHMAEADPMLDCVRAYRSYMEESHMLLSAVQKRRKYDKEYRQAQGKLISYLIERNHGGVKSRDDVQMLCEFFYPIGEIEQAVRNIEMISGRNVDVEAISVYYLLSMERIANSLITYRDGVAAIKQWVNEAREDMESDIFNCSSVFSKIEVWNLLCRMAMPDLFIAIAATEDKRGLRALYEQQSNISLSDKLLIKILSKGVAENHLHFNVGYSYDVVWLAYMNLDFGNKYGHAGWNRERITQLEMALFRYLAACYFVESDSVGRRYVGFGKWMEESIPVICGRVMREMMGMLYCGRYGEEPELQMPVGWYSQLQEGLHHMRSNGRKMKQAQGYDYLLAEVYWQYIEYKTSSEYILLYQSYRYIKENGSDSFFARIFVQYLRLKNEYFSKAFQTHEMQGLKHFQSYYDSSKQLVKNAMVVKYEIMKEVFRAQARIPHLRKLEIRIAPDVEEGALNANYSRSRRNIIRQLYSQTYNVLDAYRRYLLECSPGENVPTIGIVFHFLKAEYLEDRSGNYCWRTSGIEEHPSMHRLLRRIYVANIAMALEEIREAIPGINEYIVGIDAASNENAEEPWMFVPAYRIMRSHRYTAPVMEARNGAEVFQRIQNIGFTYHVGEDFRHIVSGLRHVDEVLEEFGYKAGDRLGHALALGIDIEQWIADNEAVPIPKLEHLENLLWMWGINTCSGLELPIKLEVLEEKIMNLAEEMYGFSETLCVRMLYRAYKKKFEFHHEDIIRQVLEGEKESSCSAGICETGECDCSYKRNKKSCYGTWTVQKLLLTNYCPVFEEVYEKVEIIPVAGDDAAVYKMLQEYLIHKVEEMGIYIETNPTSNLTIGDFAHMRQHPIFALLNGNSDGHRVFVTVNSDDPAVFNTNVENELAYIYYAAEAQGVAKSEILNWVDMIRQYGLDASFIREEKSKERILEEIHDILQEILRNAPLR